MYQAGERIGDWVVEGPLGAGGMGSVYRCRNALTERIRAAVKVVWSGGELGDARERFIREVEALESLQHPGVVRVKGWGETATGELWLAMDLVEGEDLDARLRRGPVPPDAVSALFGTLVDGLAHAHERGIFHRDIKPANVLVDPDGVGRLVDFGIAVQGDRTRVTLANTVAGTPAYLAPEVFGGTPDPRALDAYALGQVLYEVLTGRPAFPDPGSLTTTQRLAHVAGGKLRAQALDPGDAVPAGLRELVIGATQPDPGRRITDLAQFTAALEGRPIVAPTRAQDTVAFDVGGVFERSGDAAAEASLQAGPRFAEPPAETLRTLEGPEPAPQLPGAPAAPAAVQPAPSPSPPAPVPTAKGPPWARLAAGAVLLLLGVGFGAFLFTPSTREVSVRVADLPTAMPLRARLGQRWLEGPPPWSVADVRGAVELHVVAGDRCALDAYPPDCPEGCSCQSLPVAADEVDVVATVPPVLAGTRVRLGVRDAEAGARVEDGINERGGEVIDRVGSHGRFRGIIYYYRAEDQPKAEALRDAARVLTDQPITVELSDMDDPPENFDMILWLP